MSRWARPDELGIHEISKEEYLRECAKGLEIGFIASSGSANLQKLQDGDVIYASMCRPGEDKPMVSYTNLGKMWIFTRGHPWFDCTPLKLCK